MVLALSLIFVCGFALWGVLDPIHLGVITQNALSSVLENFGWFYLLGMFLFLVFALFLALSRFGTLRLGGEEAEPEFTTTSWFTMLFAAGMGIGLVFWGVAEPISHFGSPPLGLDPESPAAARAALRFTFFHYGLHPWAAYSLVALALAFFHFNRNQPMLLSSVFSSIRSQRMKTIINPLVDTLAIIATVFGVATSLGFGALQIGAGLERVFGVTNGLPLQLGIIGMAAILYLVSAMTGLVRGIQFLSNANMILATILCASLFIVGPTAFILNSFVTTLGDYFDSLIGMSMRLTPFTKATWVADWTLFYWAWWLSWSPFVGMFIARISKGRTIREFVAGVLLAPSFVSFIWFAVFGGAALQAAMFKGVPLVEVTKQDVSMALFTLLETLPLPTITSILSVLLVTVFFITSADSATFVLGMMSLKGVQNPSNKIKFVWGSLLAVIAAVLLLSGGLKGLQTMSIVTALPFAMALLIMCYFLYHELEIEHRGIRAHQKEKDRLLEQLLKAAASKTKKPE